MKPLAIPVLGILIGFAVPTFILDAGADHKEACNLGECLLEKAVGNDSSETTGGPDEHPLMNLGGGEPRVQAESLAVSGR